MIGRNDSHESEMEVGRVVSSAGSGAALARERKQADEAFIKGTKVRDGMRERLGAE
jgi:hypothetical protein